MDFEWRKNYCKNTKIKNQYFNSVFDFQAENLIKAEMYALMEWDVNGKQPHDLYTPEQMLDARKLIDAELSEKEQLDEKMWQVVSNCLNEMIRYQGRFTRISNLSRKDQLDVLSEHFKVAFSSLSFFLFWFPKISRNFCSSKIQKNYFIFG